MKGPGKGKTNNPAGRPAGTPNKVTFDMRAALKVILENEIKQLPQLLTEMDPAKRVDILAKLIQYIIPRMQNVDLKTDFELMTEGQLDRVIAELKKEDDGTI